MKQIMFSNKISMFALQFNHNKNIQKFRSQILMQFVPLPLVTLVRPTICPLTLPQIMSLALAADFKKYVVALTLNDLPSSQKDEKKSQNAQTSISSSSLEEIINGKSQEKPVEAAEKNRKSQDSFQKTNINEEKLEFILPKKRQCAERARCQITQAFQSSEQSQQEQEKESSDKQEEQITYKNKIESKTEQIKENPIKKQKKIQKARKPVRIEPKVEPEQKIQISTVVSLIDTIDHPRILIDRFEIQQKKQNLLSRAIAYDQLEQKKYNYQIRQRRELKRLN